MHRTSALIVFVVLAAACAAPQKPGLSPPAATEAPLACATPDDKLRASTPEAERGFSPITDLDAEALVGKQVYAAKITKVNNGRAEIVTGEALTLCRTVTSKTDAPHEPRPGEVVRTRNFGPPPAIPERKVWNVTVKTTDGTVADVPVRELSSRPLKYDLRHPGKAPDLIVAATREAELAARTIHQLQSQAGYDVWFDADRDVQRRKISDQLQALRSALEADRLLVNNLYLGWMSKDSILRGKGWITKAEDNTILEWMSHGAIKDPELKTRYEVLDRCTSTYQRIPGMAQEIAVDEKKKNDKSWRKGTEGNAQSKLDSLDAENVARLDASIANHKKVLDEALNDPKCKEPTP